MPVGPIPILKIGSTLLATIQIELQDTVVDSFQGDVLEEIEKTGANGLIIDNPRSKRWTAMWPAC